MSGPRFLDTNILLYAISRSPTESVKAATARRILHSKELALSVQVLQEFYVQATRPSHPAPLLHQQAVELVETFKRYPVADLTLDLVDAALRSKERYQISYWDAAIIEAARVSGCRVLLSEDLNHNQDFGGVRVENPFL
ncbi:MAG: PIN domain-containing protein [Candidatus Eremiobacteraeota bacterium]|nr:PIN domain-containing protein [Candidatus Eremiobacteraeota bacterium]